MATIGEVCNAARIALECGDIARCSQLSAALVEKRPDIPEGHFLLGMALANSGRVLAGLQAVERAIALKPFAEFHAQQARLLTLLRRDGAARAAAEAAMRLDPIEALTLDTVGCVYARLGDHEAALPLFERAVAAAPDGQQYRFNLASTYGFFGRRDDAEAQYEAMLLRDPSESRAHYALATLRRQTSGANHVARLEAALESAIEPTDRLRIHYAAAKEFEDLADHAKVFHHLSVANQAHKARTRFSIETDASNFQALCDGFSRRDYFRGVSDVPDAPIFVVGMPRTGTTLVDRILSSHPHVSSAGELQAMPLALKQLSGTSASTVLDMPTIEAAAELSPQALGQTYIASARQHVGAQSPVFIDKMPLNFLYIGYIARALPHARIVCLRRNPMDSIWSNFKNLFATTSAYYGYSYDLVDTAQFYIQFDRLMAFWEEQFPGRVLQLGYEALVDAQELETRRLLAHCGLDWSADCMAFQNNAAPVATPSAQQVRRPLNREAIGRWRHYADELEPIREMLEQRGIALPDP